MSDLGHKKCTLILNKNYQPIDIRSAKSTFMSFIRGAVALDPTDYQTYTFEQWIDKFSEVRDEFSTLRSEKLWVMIPDILIVKSTINKTRHVKVDRTKLFIRDKYTCGYCGKKFKKPDLTMDHIIPKSKGGKNSYLNLVSCCWKCNHKKGDKTLQELGWKLKFEITDPNTNMLYNIPTHKRLKSWETFI